MKQSPLKPPSTPSPWPSYAHPSPAPSQKISDALLSWFYAVARDLPWRHLKACHPDPYQVWVSEIMLQQTTVATVTPYFQRFIQKWPTVSDLARASLEDVLTLWQGLGYYRRAHHLHKAAQWIVEHHEEHFPETYEDLKALPGIGPYTAAAIMSMAYNQPYLPVDGNIARVFSRLYGLDKPLPDLVFACHAIAHTWAVEASHRGDLAQALMDLGATLCTPTHPKCLSCPLKTFCFANTFDKTAYFPRKTPKKQKPHRWTVAYGLQKEGTLWMCPRPQEGLLKGMLLCPTSPWKTIEIDNLTKSQAHTWMAEQKTSYTQDLGLDPEKECLEGVFTHTFTHFHLHVKVVSASWDADNNPTSQGFWMAKDQSHNHPLPTLMKKILTLLWPPS